MEKRRASNKKNVTSAYVVSFGTGLHALVVLAFEFFFTQGYCALLNARLRFVKPGAVSGLLSFSLTVPELSLPLLSFYRRSRIFRQWQRSLDASSERFGQFRKFRQLWHKRQTEIFPVPALSQFCWHV